MRPCVLRGLVVFNDSHQVSSSCSAGLGGSSSFNCSSRMTTSMRCCASIALCSAAAESRFLLKKGPSPCSRLRLSFQTGAGFGHIYAAATKLGEAFLSGASCTMKEAAGSRRGISGMDAGMVYLVGLWAPANVVRLDNYRRTPGSNSVRSKCRLLAAEFEHKAPGDHLDVVTATGEACAQSAGVEAEEGPVILHSKNNPVGHRVVHADAHHPAMLAFG